MAERREIRKVQLIGSRVETGPVQFGEDWPGVFIRGDRASHYAEVLSRLVVQSVDRFDMQQLRALRDLLASCRVGGAGR